MSELITRENAKQAICEVCYMFKYIGGSYTECRYYPCDDIKALEAIPSAEAPKGELISRAYAIEAVRKVREEPEKYYTQYNIGVDCSIKALSALPSADAKERVISAEKLKRMKFVAIKGDKTEEAYRTGWNGAIDCVIGEYASADAVSFEDAMEIRNTILFKEYMRGRRDAEAAQGWIPCSERLPDVDVEVITTTDWSEILIAWLRKGGAWETDEYILASDEILAWMPLPEPYKGR